MPGIAVLMDSSFLIEKMTSGFLPSEAFINIDMAFLTQCLHLVGRKSQTCVLLFESPEILRKECLLVSVPLEFSIKGPIQVCKSNKACLF